MGSDARREVVEVNVNRWVWLFRIIGILMLLGFLLLFANLQRRLEQMQGERPPAATTTT
jgi:hypothetical protein